MPHTMQTIAVSMKEVGEYATQDRHHVIAHNCSFQSLPTVMSTEPVCAIHCCTIHYPHHLSTFFLQFSQKPDLNLFLRRVIFKLLEQFNMFKNKYDIYD